MADLTNPLTMNNDGTYSFKFVGETESEIGGGGTTGSKPIVIDGKTYIWNANGTLSLVE